MGRWHRSTHAGRQMQMQLPSLDRSSGWSERRVSGPIAGKGAKVCMQAGIEASNRRRAVVLVLVVIRLGRASNVILRTSNAPRPSFCQEPHTRFPIDCGGVAARASIPIQELTLILHPFESTDRQAGRSRFPSVNRSSQADGRSIHTPSSSNQGGTQARHSNHVGRRGTAEEREQDALHVRVNVYSLFVGARVYVCDWVLWCGVGWGIRVRAPDPLRLAAK